MRVPHEWEELGRVAPAELTDARQQLHWAVQILPALADAWLQKAPDDSHSNSEWREPNRALVGRPLGTQTRIRMGLQPADLTLIALGERTPGAGDWTRHRELSLPGRTLAEGLAWAAECVHAGTGIAASPRLREYEMPAHTVGSGSPFGAVTDAHVELARWYANVDGLLRPFAAEAPGASPVACWPHHFDIATLIDLEVGVDAKNGHGEDARSVGVGMSPGDATYPQPYWYVSPWPRPDADVPRPPLAAGGEWAPFGPVLLGNRLTEAGGAAQQADAAAAFVASAVSAAVALVDG